MLYNLHFFSSKCRLFHNATLFGFCITHILNTGCAKIWKKLRRQKVKDTVRSSVAAYPFKYEAQTALKTQFVPRSKHFSSRL